MKTRNIGPFQVSEIGLGAMPLSIEGRPSWEQAFKTIAAALDAGVTLIDTADAYHMAGEHPGHNEELVAEALAAHGRVPGLLLATKGGHYRPSDGSWLTDGRPEHLRQAARASAKRLRVEAIDLYQFHRPDPQVPFVESVGALRELLDDGVIRYAGLSNVDHGQIDAAREILGDKLVSVQNQFSASCRKAEPDIAFSAERGLAFIPYRPLGGLSAAYADGGDYSAFHRVASEHEVSVQRVALAWLLAKGPNVLPIPGSSRPETILDSVAAVDLTLTDAELAALG
ncbi:MAG: aldo/keto reductase [Propionibacteriaceae bacterium]|jgi:aryl-alcohol dehydrogenase-like predicted oxidoreductase|nr:aldo/keto reductase [Propionibacteriaceae bacterium]